MFDDLIKFNTIIIMIMSNFHHQNDLILTLSQTKTYDYHCDC